jgi:secreted trypsin-like serine protease
MRQKLLLGIALVGAMLCTVLSTGTANAIIGGQDATQPYPFMASITLDGQPWCGGPLLTPDIVATASHCVGLKELPVTANELRVRVGSNSPLSGGTVVGVSQIIVNPAWNEDTAMGDISLLKLSHQVPYQPIPILPWKPRVGTLVRNLGFGCTVLPNACTLATLPTTLQQLDTTVVNAKRCTISLINTKELCSGPARDGANDCAGDSGSPQVIKRFGRWLLVGTISRDGDFLPADTGNCQGDTAVSVSAADYLPWIERVVWQTDHQQVITS